MAVAYEDVVEGDVLYFISRGLSEIVVWNVVGITSGNKQQHMLHLEQNSNVISPMNEREYNSIVRCARLVVERDVKENIPEEAVFEATLSGKIYDLYSNYLKEEQNDREH